MKKRKWIAALFLILLFSALYSVFDNQAEEKQGYRYVVGVVLENSTMPRNAWLIQQIKHGKDIPEDMNILLKESQNSAEQQVKDMEEMLHYGVDVLVVSPIWEDAVKDALQRIHSNLPVIILHENRAAAFANALIEYDNIAAGRMIAEYALQFPQAKEGVVLLTGDEKDNVAQQRKKAILEVLEQSEYPWYELPVSGNRNEAENSMKYFIVSERKAGMILAVDDQKAYGAYLAAKQLRVENLLFFGMDGFDGAAGGKTLQNQGILQASIAFEDLYQKLCSVALELIKEETVEKHAALQAVMIVGE